MTKHKRRIAILSVITVAFLALLPLVNYSIERKIENYISNLPDHFIIHIEDIKVNLISRKIDFINVNLTLLGKTDKSVNAEIVLDYATFKGFSFRDILFNNTITVNKLVITHPQINYQQSEGNAEKNTLKNRRKAKLNLFKIHHFEIVEGEIEMCNTSNASTVLHVKQFNLKLDDVTHQFSTFKNIPVSFNDYNLNAQSIFINAGVYETLEVDTLLLNTQNALMKSLVFKTKYSKYELSKQLKNERDHFHFTVDSLSFSGLDFGFKTDTTLTFKSEKIKLFKPELAMFRDKRVNDDYKEKPLYSKMLRDLNFNMGLDTISIIDGKIIYEEKIKQDAETGRLVFKRLNSELKNIGNVYNDSIETTIETEAFFMKNAPLKAYWAFNVNDKNDHFTFKGELGQLNASTLNSFTEPNTAIRLEGQLNKTYFTIDGNSHTANVDLKINYDAFSVIILKDGEHKKNKLLSAIANIFISKNSHNKTDNFLSGEKEAVQRDKTKSIFNFLWLNLKQALRDAMT